MSTESSVVELSDGRIMLNSRSKGAYRTVGYSADGGDTFDSFEEKKSKCAREGARKPLQLRR